MSTDQFYDVSTAFDDHWQEDTTVMSRQQTARLTNGKLNPNVLVCRDYLFGQAESFNLGQESVKFRSFQWCQFGKADSDDPVDVRDDPSDEDILAADYAMFGLRLGTDAPEPEHKMVLICHLDTVPADPNSDVWEPYNPFVEKRNYPAGQSPSPQDFLVGRGCVDDKGPAASGLVAARCLAKKYDGPRYAALWDKVQIELLFDSSEETDMSTPQYLESGSSAAPDFGIVFDAFWNVRAEKGGERPVFWTDPPEVSTDIHKNGIVVQALITSPENSTNTIPDYADVTFASKDKAEIEGFASKLPDLYKNAVFDDPNYNKAKVEDPEVADDGLSVRMRALVAGAQHGSAPEENRALGANPLVSLANFVNSLVVQGEVVPNYVSTLACFLAETWGTYTFGEGDDRLEEHDEVFEKGNGTSYALTKTEILGSNGELTTTPGRMRLSLDIRYAINHHEEPWDGVTEGYLPGSHSTFKGIFNEIASEFNSRHANWPDVGTSTATIFNPDIRTPDTNEHFLSVEDAYRQVMHQDPMRFAIGGGTDAKGYIFLTGAGPLFDPAMGDPINYHGLHEGAPMADMKKSTEILYQVLVNQILPPASLRSGAARNGKGYKQKVKRNIEQIRQLRKRGLKMVCRH